MGLDWVQLIAGLGILLVGGELMVRGAASLARSLGVSPLAIGLTVVAFGTSAPELAVNLTAAWRGNGELSFGNIFGSNMANIGVVIAVAALLRPLAIHGTVIRREMPMMLLATGVAIIMAFDRWFDSPPQLYTRGDGLILLSFFGVFLYYTIGEMVRSRHSDALVREASEELGIAATPSPARDLALTVGGLVGLVLGAQVTVGAAVALARAFGVSEDLIGLTLVAVGTSLPELTAAIVATLRGHTDMAVGNVVGSNIFNLLLVLGVSAIVRPVPVPLGGYGDLAITAVLSLSLMGLASSQTRLIRWEAGVLMLVYFSYILYRSVTSMGAALG